jgi:DNA-binding NarL/FixJ family response regulator
MLSDELIRVIREVHDGLTPSASPEVVARLAERAGHPNLTPREVQVLELLSTGMRNREIAAALGISGETVQVHIKRVLAKLQAQDRTAAVNIGVRRGIIHLE